MSDVRACAVVPTYDNAGTIGDVVRRASATGLLVIVVDDGSRDGTGERARDAGADVVVHEANRGKGEALVTGLAHAAGRGFTHAVTLDGDGQHFPEDAPALLDLAAASPRALVVGARPWEGPNRGRGQRFGRWFSNLWVWIDGRIRVEDSQSGFRVYPVAETLALRVRASRYDWEMEVLVRAAWAGLAVLSTPIRVYYPPAGERVSHFHAWRDNARISRTFALLFLLRPLALLLGPRPVRAALAEADRSWDGRAQGTAFGWHATWWIMRVLGRRAVYGFLRPVALWYALFAARGRAASNDYLERVLGPASPLGRLRRVRDHFLAFATYLVDRFWLLGRGPNAFDIESENMEGLRAALDEGRGGILLTSHFGNAEVAGIGLSIRRGVPVRLVMYQNERAEIRRFLDRFGSRMPEVIAIRPGGLGSLEILKALRQGALVAMKADRVMDTNYVRVPFLGAEAAFPTGPFLIAAAARAPLFEVHCTKEGPTRYRIRVEGPHRLVLEKGRDRDAQVEAWVRGYAARLERHVRAHPFQWYNFYRFWDPPALPGRASGGAGPAT